MSAYIRRTRLRQVCVVTEHVPGWPNPSFLFGVFSSEREARLAYGEPAVPHEPTFDVVPLWAVTEEPAP